MSDFTKGLNDSQKQAVLHNDGPLLVLAGAGSGKTRVLTMRIARLVAEKRCSPEEILAVTFTNKAAKEMKERVASILSPKIADQMTLCTFHSFGVKILREDGESIGLSKNFTIIDSHEQVATIKSIMRANGVRGLKKEDPDEFLNKISLAKNASFDPSEYKEKNPDERKLYRVYNSYSQILLKRQTVDFDDLLLFPLQIFQKNPAILRKYRSRYRFISIDEFQDTNAVQMKLASLMASPRNNLMVVGDDDQGIYSWRGAEIENILSFSSNFKNCTTVILDINYRSSHQILAGAHAVVSKNRIRKHKVLKAANGDGDPIMHYKGEDEIDEANWVATKIAEHNEHTGFGFGDHAILVRTNAMMRGYEEELRKKNIPYKVSGALSFFERKEIKDVIAYMRFFSNPNDELSLERVLKVPSKGISSTSLEKLDEFAGFRKMSLWDAISSHTELKDLSEDQHAKIEKLISYQKRGYTGLESGVLSSTIRTMLNECNYLELLRKAYKEDDDYKSRIDNVEELLRGLEKYEFSYKRKKPTMTGYLQEIALMTSEEERKEDKSVNNVVLMTLHKSKGLEFPVVFLAGLDSTYIPSPRAIEEGGIDEERRLFYVGMTRAQKRLFLSYPGTKLYRGKISPVIPCPFLREIPEEFLDGKIGEKQDDEKRQFIDDFFKQMKSKFTPEELEM